MKAIVTAVFFVLLAIMVLPEAALAQWDPDANTCDVGTLKFGSTMVYGQKYKIVSPDNPTKVLPCIEGLNDDKLSIMASSVCLVQAVIAQAMFAVYCDILNGMMPIFRILIALYIIFYTFCFLFGLADVNGRDFAIRLIKVMAIYAFATNPGVFMRYFFLPWFGMIDGIAREVAVLYNYGGAEFMTDENIKHYVKQIIGFGPTGEGGSGHLSFFLRIDLLFQQLVGQEAIPGLLLLAIMFLFTGSGFWVGLLLMCGVISMIVALITLVITYTTAMIALTYLLMFTPIFFALALFSTTRKIFEGWMAALISYTMQPILLYIMMMILAAAMNVGQAGLNELLVPKDKTACQASSAARDKECNKTVIDVEACSKAEKLVLDTCFPAIIALKTKTEFNLGLAKISIPNIPKPMDGTAGTLQPDTGANAKPGALVFKAGANPDKPMEDDPSLLNLLKDKALPNILAFIVIGAIVSQFLACVPKFAHYLAAWKSQRATPIIGRSMDLSSKDGLFGSGNTGTRGVFSVGSWARMGMGRALTGMADFKGNPAAGAAGLAAFAAAAQKFGSKKEEKKEEKEMALRGDSSGLPNISDGFMNRPEQDKSNIWSTSIASITGQSPIFDNRGGSSGLTPIADGTTPRESEWAASIADGDTPRDHPSGFSIGGGGPSVLRQHISDFIKKLKGGSGNDNGTPT